jgi:hypothetical protein
MSTMSAFSPALLLAMLVLGLFGTVALVRIGRTRRRATRRVVEQPNSHYTSQLVRETEARHRWYEIEVDRVHEINRGEVARLLVKVEVGGPEALRADERTFLDYMAELARKSSTVRPVREEEAPARAASSRTSSRVH